MSMRLIALVCEDRVQDPVVEAYDHVQWKWQVRGLLVFNIHGRLLTAMLRLDIQGEWHDGTLFSCCISYISFSFSFPGLYAVFYETRWLNERASEDDLWPANVRIEEDVLRRIRIVLFGRHGAVLGKACALGILSTRCVTLAMQSAVERRKPHAWVHQGQRVDWTPPQDLSSRDRVPGDLADRPNKDFRIYLTLLPPLSPHPSTLLYADLMSVDLPLSDRWLDDP
ncbi:hypothetical protein BU17DRAFT_72591 [Hysterangium stoloniferum]|nr:hypothetical protein BU17DRAFT_72591 [Hysterangium stoloniferum]